MKSITLKLKKEHTMTINNTTNKSSIIAYILYFVLGAFSAHRFYLGYVKTGIAQTLLLFTGFLTGYFGVGVPLLAIWLIWYIIDIFLVAMMVSNHNKLANADLTAAAG